MDPKRVLVVDDEPAMTMSIRVNLELAGYEVTVAASGPAAIEVLARERFDLVLTDLYMAGTSGVDVAREAARRSATTVIVVMTGLPSDEVVDHARAAGACRVIMKPFDFDELLDSLR